MNDPTVQKKPFATPMQYAVCSVFICVIGMLVSAVLFSLFDKENAGHFGIIIGGIIGLVIYLIKEHTLDLKKQKREFDISVPTIFFLLNWTACGLASTVFGVIFSRFSAKEPDTESTQTLISVIGAVIIAPIGEELMFRLCSMGLLKKCSGKFFTILFPTTIFSLLHCFYGLHGSLEIFAGALFIAVCYYYTENILYAIMIHMAHNLLCLPDLSFKETSLNGYSALKLPAFIVYAVIFAAGMVWYIKVFKKKFKT